MSKLALNCVYNPIYSKMAENAKNGKEAKKGNFWTFKACKMSIDSSEPKDLKRGFHSFYARKHLDMMLSLAAPEYSHNQWHKSKEFTEFLRLNNVYMVLFFYKDQIFGCLSRAAAVLLYNMEWLNLLLQENPSINNRLDCLVRDLLEIPYIKAFILQNHP